MEKSSKDVYILAIISKIFTEQWVFMVIAALGVALTFAMKKIVPNFYRTFLRGELIIFSVVLILLAFRGSPDLFLLVPIIIICCELFGYDVTGKIVGVLFIDFLLIQLDFRLISKVNETLMNIVFFVLQIAVAVCIGMIMDNHLKNKSKNHEELKQLEEIEDKEALSTEKTESNSIERVSLTDTDNDISSSEGTTKI